MKPGFLPSPVDAPKFYQPVKPPSRPQIVTRPVQMRFTSRGSSSGGRMFMRGLPPVTPTNVTIGVAILAAAYYLFKK